MKLSSPTGLLVKLAHPDVPYVVDVSFFEEGEDKGLVKTIHKVYRYPDFSVRRAEDDPDDLVIDGIHDELNRGKWEQYVQ